jgi:hypothetical protein
MWGVRIMDLEELKEKFRSFKKSEIIITGHAEIQALFRDISIDEVRENIVSPDRLVYLEKI